VRSIGLRAPGYRLLALFTLVVCGGLALTLSQAVAQPAPPELTRPVNDFAQVIDQASADALDRDIRALQAATGDVVAVATIATFAPYGDIDEYAVKMFENHGKGIGQKGKDNAVLVLVAVRDRRDRIEVGYGLEQFITDGFAGETRRRYMAPAFARGEFGPGLVAGVRQLIGRIAQGRGVTITGIPQPTSPGGSALQISPVVIIFVIILFIAIARAIARANRGSVVRRGRWGGGPWSGWNSGVGPFGGGGGFGGGGFGGGFGGFGGGRSGGGGASGGW
jgi:uncharacterized protein